MHLLTDPAELAALLKANARDDWRPDAGDAAQWLAQPRNFALADGGDLGMFTARGEWPGPLEGHVFFASRGRRALEVARTMLGRAFDYGATEILGETPARYRDAVIFARLLGFERVGEAERPYGMAVLSRLTINNFRARFPVA